MDRYEGVDWTKSGSQIARELGVTRQAVSEAKAQRGLRPRRSATVRQRIIDWFDEYDGPEMPHRKIAEAIGCSPTAVRNYLNEPAPSFEDWDV